MDTGVELARFCDGFSKPLDEVCAFCWHVPSLLLFYPTQSYSMLHKAWLAFVGLGSPLKLNVWSRACWHQERTGPSDPSLWMCLDGKNTSPPSRGCGLVSVGVGWWEIQKGEGLLSGKLGFCRTGMTEVCRTEEDHLTDVSISIESVNHLRSSYGLL